MILGIYFSIANKCKHFIQEDNQVHSEGTIIYEQVALMPMIPISATLVFLSSSHLRPHGIEYSGLTTKEKGLACFTDDSTKYVYTTRKINGC